MWALINDGARAPGTAATSKPKAFREGSTRPEVSTTPTVHLTLFIARPSQSVQALDGRAENRPKPRRPRGRTKESDRRSYTRSTGRRFNAVAYLYSRWGKGEEDEGSGARDYRSRRVRNARRSPSGLASNGNALIITELGKKRIINRVAGAKSVRSKTQANATSTRLWAARAGLRIIEQAIREPRQPNAWATIETARERASWRRLGDAAAQAEYGGWRRAQAMHARMNEAGGKA